jgi:hypothetical protein
MALHVGCGLPRCRTRFLVVPTGVRVEHRNGDRLDAVGYFAEECAE